MITSILHGAPLLAILIPLLLGRYPGEERILSRRRRRAAASFAPPVRAC